MKFSREQIKEAVVRKGYRYFESGDYNVNIIGVRNSDTKNIVTNRFDDTMTVAYKINDEWQHHEMDCTTDPGTHWVENIMRKEGVAILKEGQYPGSEKEKMEPWLVPIRSNMRKVYNKPLILEKMEKEEKIELVSLAHFRGRTFDNSVVIVDEFQNLTRSQLAMAIGRLGKDSKILFCGDSYQIDLKDKNWSAYYDMSKLVNSEHVFKTVLEDSHRHRAIDELLELLNGYH